MAGETEGAPESFGRSISRHSLLLTLFAVLTTAGASLTYIGTRERIAAREQAAREKALQEIVPIHRYDNELLTDVLPVADRVLLGYGEPRLAYVARQAGIVTAVLLPVIAPDGYTEALDMLVGINQDGSIAGVRVVRHRETPGLGDKVDLRKSPWILGFSEKSLAEPPPGKWKVKKDGGSFDQFTGATVTPRAVVLAVYRSLRYAEKERRMLFGKPGEKAK